MIVEKLLSCWWELFWRTMNEKIKQLIIRQALPLDLKEQYTERRIKEWYEYWKGEVYVSFSGGKDSTVLLHQVRKLYPTVPAVFIDTGLEYPEIKEFVKTINNVIYLKPKMTFDKVIKKYGYPVISKQTSMGLDRYRNTKSDLQKQLRLYGGINPTSGKKQAPTIYKKWHFLTNAPFKCSDYCCTVLKKSPILLYNKKSGRKAYIGTMASDSNMRKMGYLQTGCNAFKAKYPSSTPLTFWIEQDIWDYINKYDIPYSKIYDIGLKRTGCMFCMFGIHMEKGENRFQLMKKTHPKQYDLCINKMNCKEVLDFLGIKY